MKEMIEDDIINRLKIIMVLIDNTNSPIINTDIIDISKIKKVNEATTKAYDEIDHLIADIKRIPW